MTLNVPKFSPRLQPKSRVYDSFRIGTCVQGDSTEIKQLRDCQNAVMDRFGFQKRQGITKKGASIGAVKVTGLQEVIIGVKTYLLAVCAQVLKKWCVTDSDIVWSNTDKTTLTTTLNTYIRSFNFIDGSTVDTGTSSGTNNTTRVMYDTAKTWTVDAYIGKILHISGGTGNGQRKLIVANDTNRIYVNEPFSVTPDATSTYAVYTPTTQACVANGTDTLFKYNGTTSTNLTTPQSVKFADIEVHDKRLWGISGNYIYFSDESVGDQFSQDSIIPFEDGQGSLLRLQKLNQQLIVYKRNSFAVISGENGTYGIQPRSASVGLLAPNSVATGAEMQFFLSTRGVEVVNRYENDVTADILPISENITAWLDAHNASEKAKACGTVFGNFYYLTIPYGSTYYTYAYDILYSDYTSPDPDAQRWYRFLGWPANIWAHLDGVLSFGSDAVASNGYVYSAFTGDSDDGTDIAVAVQTLDDDFGLPDANKDFNKIHIFGEESTANIIYTVKYRLDVADDWTTLGTVAMWNDLEYTPARGTMTLTGLPTATNTFRINATTITAVASGATGDQFNIGATADVTADNIVACVNAGTESANVLAYKGGSGIVIFEWKGTGVKGSLVVFTESMANTTITGSGTLTGTANGRLHKELDLYKSGRTLGIRIERTDALAASQGEIIKVVVHFNPDQRE